MNLKEVFIFSLLQPIQIIGFGRNKGIQFIQQNTKALVIVYIFRLASKTLTLSNIRYFKAFTSGHILNEIHQSVELTYFRLFQKKRTKVSGSFGKLCRAFFVGTLIFLTRKSWCCFAFAGNFKGDITVSPNKGSRWDWGTLRHKAKSFRCGWHNLIYIKPFDGQW